MVGSKREGGLYYLRVGYCIFFVFFLDEEMELINDGFIDRLL